MKKLAFVFLFFLLIEVVTVSAQTSAAKIYNLDDCLLSAQRNNWDIKGIDPKLNQTTADMTNAFGYYLPSINLSMSYERNINPADNSGGSQINLDSLPEEYRLIALLLQNQGYSTNSPNTYSIGASVNWLLFDGFSREANYKRAEKNQSAVETGADFTRQTVSHDVYTNYINVVKNKQIVKIREENLELGKKELDRINAQFQAGTINIGVVYAQEADLGTREIELVRAQNDLDIAKSQLLTVMGLDPSSNADFLESSVPSSVTKDAIEDYKKNIGSLPALLSDAAKHRLDLKSSNYQVDASQTEVDAAKAGYYPKISAVGGWRWNYTELTDFSKYGNSYIGLQISVPIFDNFNTNYKIQNAKLQTSENEIQYRKAEQNVRQSVQTAYLNLLAADKQIEISQRSQRSAELNYESAKQRFEVGSASITDLLQANSQLITAKINTVTSVYAYIQSQKDIEFTTGVLK